MKEGKIDFKAIADAALQRAEELLAKWLPQGKRDGHEWKALNPTRDDSRLGSFSINLNTGAWADFATQDRGRDLISLYAYLFTRGEQGEAARTLARELGIASRAPGSTDEKKPAKRGSPWQPILPAPHDDGVPVAHLTRGRPQATWRYADAEGRTLGFVYRFRTSDGGKEVLPLCWARHVETGKEEWRWMAFPTPRPLYGLDRLAAMPAGKVLVVEGEKCADAAHAELADYGYVCVAWPGGSKAVDKAGWSALAQREVILWPDCDSKRDKDGALFPKEKQPGMTAMTAIAAKLATIGCRVRMVDIPAPGEKPDGWDIADVIADGVHGEALACFMRDRLTDPPAPPTPPRNGTLQARPDDGKPVIQLHKGKLHEILDHADAALGERDGKIFDHFGRLVRVTNPDEEDVVNGEPQRRAGAILLRDMTVPNLCDRLAQVAHWEKWDARKEDYVNADVPRGVAESLLARAGEWRRIPKLTGFVEAPTLRDDGSVFDVPGYDRRSGLFFAGSVPAGYGQPLETREAAMAAAELFLDLFAEIPTDTLSDRTAILSAVLTSLVRRVLPSAPLIGITAPLPGTGKSLIADAISILATGRRAAVMGIGKNEEEGEKRLHAALLAGDPVVSIDNVERALYDEVLCQAVTQPNIRIRPLGSTQQLSTPTNTLLVATGNNLDVRGDMRRRVLLVRLDAKMERPETREFKTDLLAETMRRRGQLVKAGLTVIRAYLAAGSPRPMVTVTNDDGVSRQEPLRPFGSFDEWSRLCRASLVWLGFPDPLLASESLREQDPDLVVQRQLFISWDAIYEQKDVTAAEVIAASSVPEHSDLRSALETICQERVAARRFGYWLRRHRNRVVDGIRLESRGLDRNKVAVWRMVRMVKS